MHWTDWQRHVLDMPIVEMQGKVLLLRVNGVQRASLKCQNDDTYIGRH